MFFKKPRSVMGVTGAVALGCVLASMAEGESTMQVKFSYDKGCSDGMRKCVDKSNDHLRGDISFDHFELIGLYLDQCLAELGLPETDLAKCKIGARGKLFMDEVQGCTASRGLGISFTGPKGLERFSVLNHVSFDRAPRFCIDENTVETEDGSKFVKAKVTGTDCSDKTTSDILLSAASGGQTLALPRPSTDELQSATNFGLPSLFVPNCDVEQVDGLVVYFDSKLPDSANPSIYTSLIPAAAITTLAALSLY